MNCKALATSQVHAAIHQDLKVATWNVRGLTDVKLVEIMVHMRRHDIHILCSQETRATKAEEYEDENCGFYVILSGADTEDTRAVLMPGEN